MQVKYSYLDKQFENIDPYLEDIRALVQRGDFTIGQALTDFENRFARLLGLPHTVGVGTGTDALMLPLKILGVGAGDEVITSPNTFVATVGAIAMTGARPVFVDNGEDFTINVTQIEKAITPRTKAIMPVHLTGCPADMPAIMQIAERHKLLVIEDAAQAILATIDGKSVGSWGAAAGFSLHPLKNLNVWGDAGVSVTRSPAIDHQLRLYRNHGLTNRDEVELWGHNCRMDTLQAVVGNRLIDQAVGITEKRIANAKIFDEAFKDISQIKVPRRKSNVKQVFHTYVIRVEERDRLHQHLMAQGIEAKIHYPIPLHLQKAAAKLGYKPGDFPVCESDCQTIITLPVHQHLTDDELSYTIETIKKFYKRS